MFRFFKKIFRFFKKIFWKSPFGPVRCAQDTKNFFEAAGKKRAKSFDRTGFWVYNRRWLFVFCSAKLRKEDINGAKPIYIFNVRVDRTR